MSNSLEVNTRSINDKVMLECKSSQNPDSPIIFDFLPPIGDGKGFVGIETLCMSFSGCVSTAVLALLKRTGKSFANYKMKAVAIKRAQPLSLEKIIAEVSIDSDEIADEEMQKIMGISADISPVWIAIKNNVEVEFTYTINRS